jgi:hypothetical protein
MEIPIFHPEQIVGNPEHPPGERAYPRKTVGGGGVVGECLD